MGAGSSFAQGADTTTVNPYAGSTNPYYQAANAQALGNLAGAQTATAANRVNQNTPYANLNYTQTVDANGNPTWTANQTLSQPLQTALGNIQGQLASSTASPFDVSPYQAGQIGQGPQLQNLGAAANQQGIGNAPTLQSQVQGTGMEGWDKATGLLMNRLNPQIQQSQERLQAQLANQGIAPGTEAYNRAMTQQGQTTNDLLTQAQLAGSQVQNTMFGQNLQAGQFGNTALTQGNANQLANLGFSNQAQQQNYANQQAMLQQNNAAAQQQYSNQIAAQQANNAAMGQNYSQNLAARNLPLSQLNAFQQGTTPGYVNTPLQAASTGADYMGALGSLTNANIAAENARLGQATANTSGLYGLGSAGILGLAANPGLVSSAGNAISGAYNWLTS